MTVATALNTDPRIFTFATRVNQRNAEQHFHAGGAVLISEHGRETRQPVYLDTVFHTPETTTWDQLLDDVRSWRHRSPNQRFYILEPLAAAELARELTQLLREHSLDVFNTRLRESPVTPQQSHIAAIAYTLSRLLACAIALSTTTATLAA